MDPDTKRVMAESERDELRSKVIRLEAELDRQKKLAEAYKGANANLSKMVKGWKEFGELMTEKEHLRETIEAINKLLYWDYDEEQWKAQDADPQWVGLDELCEIASLLSRNDLDPY